MSFINIFIMNERKRLHISREKLSSGLGIGTELRKIESGQAHADKFLYDTLLQRLDVGESYFEHYVLDEDHELQQLRFNIVEKILKRENVSDDIKKYSDLIDYNSNLHTQFIEYSKLLKYELEEYDIKTLVKSYENIIKMTVPKFDSDKFKEILLSDVETYLITKYTIYLLKFNKEEGVKFALKFLNFFQKDNLSSGKIRCYIILILKICEIYFNEFNYKNALDLANVGIDILRKNEIYTYLLSLLELKQNILSITKSDKLELSKIEKWVKTLRELYIKYKVNPDNTEFNINLFTWNNYHIISDVIKKRRIMYGLSQESLADDICDVKTISRIENKRTRIHPKLAEKLLAKLGLTGELCSDNIVTDDIEVYELCKNTTTLMNRNEFLKVADNLKIIEQKLDLNNKINLQYYKHKKILVEKHTKGLSAEDFIIEAKKTLNLTLPTKALEKTQVHLSKKEIILVGNIIENLKNIDKYDDLCEYMKFLDDYFEKIENQIISVDAYSFYCRMKQSVLGDEKSFDKSNSIIENCIKNNFDCQYYIGVIALTFAKSWNDKEQHILLNEDNLLDKKAKKIYMKSLETPYILAEIFNYGYMTKFIDDEIFSVNS